MFRFLFSENPKNDIFDNGPHFQDKNPGLEEAWIKAKIELEMLKVSLPIY